MKYNNNKKKMAAVFNVVQEPVLFFHSLETALKWADETLALGNFTETGLLCALSSSPETQYQHPISLWYSHLPDWV